MVDPQTSAQALSIDPPMMQDVGNLIQSHRQARRITQARLANLVGCHKSYLSLIESGHKGPPSDDLLERIEDALGLPRGELIAAARWQSLPDSMQAEFERLRLERQMARRLAELLGEQSFDDSGRVAGALERARRNGELGRIIGALGGGSNSSSALPMEVPIVGVLGGDAPQSVQTGGECVRVPGLHDADAIAMRISGDSMAPDYRPGDIVVFSPAAEVRTGADCLVQLNAAEVPIFRRAYFERVEGGAEFVRLQPVNSSYPPLSVKRDRLAALYPAFSVTRSVSPPADAAR